MRMDLPAIYVACEVENPLLGPEGATRIYGPQKGAGDDDLDALEDVLGKVVQITDGYRESELPGAGAAGGLGFGLVQFCNARLIPGFDVVTDEIGLLDKIQSADVVVTGEGKLDAQTYFGKGPAEVAKLAKRAGKRVAVIAGIVESEHDPALFDHVLALHDGNMPLEATMQRSEELLEMRARELAMRLASGA